MKPDFAKFTYTGFQSLIGTLKTEIRFDAETLEPRGFNP